jgi:hypothetical protein
MPSLKIEPPLRLLPGPECAVGPHTFVAAPASSGAAVEALLRRPRSPRYLEQLRRLDAASLHRVAAAWNALGAELEAELEAELPPVAPPERPLGVVARCYLGTPFEVHLCDFTGRIVTHVEVRHPLPPPFERARLLVHHPAFLAVEVYSTVLRTIGPSGEVGVFVGLPAGDRR